MMNLLLIGLHGHQECQQGPTDSQPHSTSSAFMDSNDHPPSNLCNTNLTLHHHEREL